VSRVFGPSVIGDINFSISFASIFSLFSTFGISVFGVREIAKVRDSNLHVSNLVSNFFSINILTTTISVLLYLSICLIIPSLRNKIDYLLIAGISIISLPLSIDWYFQSLEAFEYIAIRSIVLQILSLFLILFFIRIKENSKLYLFFLVLPLFITSIFNQQVARRKIKIHFELPNNIKLFFQSISNLFYMSIVGVIYQNIYTISIWFYLSSSASGLFSTAIKIESFLQSLIGSIALVLSPRCSYYLAKSLNKDFDNIIESTIIIINIIAIPVVVGVIFYSKEIILIFSGGMFIQSSSILSIISLNIFIVSLNNVLGYQILIPRGNDSVILHASILGAIVSIASLSILIPIFSFYGAALSFVLSELVMFIFLFSKIKHKILSKKYFNSFIKIILANTILIVYILLTKKIIISYSVNLLFIIPISIILYFSTLIILKEEIIFSTFIVIKNKLFNSPRSSNHAN